MIVKDEESVLKRCLDSISPLVDEIIIADTGSSDATREIAALFTDKIYDFPWIDDFSAARNFSFSKASMDYIMWMDADDVFDMAFSEKFTSFKDAGFDGADTVMMPYETSFDEKGEAVFSYYRERILKRSRGFLWQGRVHEAVSGRGFAVYSDIPIKHKSQKTSYSDRNLRIYEKQISEGAPLSPRDTFYYGRELYYHKSYYAAVGVLKGFLHMDDGWKENKIEACRILSSCSLALNNPQKALKELFTSFLWDSPRAEVCCDIGQIFVNLSDYEKAVFWYESALRIPEDRRSGAFVSADAYGYLPYIQLCVCFDRLGDRRKAEEYNKMAGACRPRSEAYLKNLQYFASLSGK